MDIPNYKLYGSRDDWDVIEPLHCETIKSRSKEHDWRIKPHRHEDIHQFIFLRSGEALSEIDGQYHRFTKPTLMYFAPMTIHGFNFEPDIDGYVLSIQHHALPDGLRRLISLFPPHMTHIVLQDAPFEQYLEQFSILFKNIYGEFHGNEIIRKPMIEGYILVFLSLFLRATNAIEPVLSVTKSSNEKLADRFKELVNIYYAEHQPISFYCEKLGVTVTKLSSTCKAVLNKTPKAICHQRLILEARRQLQYSAYSIAEISHDLGFKDVAYFSRFFKTQTDSSPGEFRQSS